MRGKNQMVVSIALLAAVLSITIGFAAFTTNLTIRTGASVTPDASTFSVKFSKVSGSIQDGASNLVTPISGNGEGALITNSSNPTIEGLKANFTNVGESVVYEFYAVNDGEFDAYLTKVNFLNIDGKNVSKYCTAGAGATQSLVDSACQGINIKVNVAGFGDANPTRDIKGHKLLKGASEKVTVTISYDSGYVDGSLSIDFGDISLTYSSIDNESGDTAGGIDTPEGGEIDTPEGGEIDTPEGGEIDTPEGGSTAYLCKRATLLHEEKCTSTDGCAHYSDYTEGEIIEYGNLGTRGTLTSGDAFDCDVDGNGEYNSTTERFYYVSDYYDGDTNTFNSDVATLVYYSNTVGATPDNTTTIAYNSDYTNYNGPVTAVVNLPTTREWSNVGLYKTTRQIRNSAGGLTTDKYGGQYAIVKYLYSGYAARLLTYQELDRYCGTSTLTTCSYLMENTRYSNSSNVSGYWIETPDSYVDNHVYLLDSRLGMTRYSVGEPWYYGVRPAIDVLKSDMEI